MFTEKSLLSSAGEHKEATNQFPVQACDGFRPLQRRVQIWTAKNSRLYPVRFFL